MTDNNKPSTFLRYLLIIFTLFILVISIAGYRYYQNQKEQFKAHKHAELTAITKLKVKQIVEWRKERISDARTILSNPYIGHEISDFIKNPSPGENYNRLFLWMSILQENFDYRDLTLVGLDGKIYFTLSEQKKELCTLTVGRISEGIQSKEVIFSDLHKHSSGTIHIDLIIPLLENNSAYGILLAEINPSLFLYPLIQQWPTPSRSAESLLIRREGNDILFLNELRHRKNTALSLRFPISQEDLPASLAARGVEGIVEGNDYRGIPVLADVIEIPETPWYMVTKVDTDEIYQPIADKAAQTVFIIIILIFLCFLVMIFIWHNQRVSFYKKQYEAEVERKALIRHFGYLSRYANDIILLMDSKGKIVEANERTLKAYGYNINELLDLNIENLRTQDSDSGVALLMRNIEEKNGLIFETVHQRKDGSTFPVEVSARHMEIEGKYYFQSIIRDITEKKQAEEKLNKANRLYATLSQVNQAIVRERDKQKLFQEICNIAIEYGKFRLAWIGFVNKENEFVKPVAFSGESSDYLQNIEISVKDSLIGKGPTGMAIRDGKSIIFNDLVNNPDFAPWRERALEKGYRSSAAFPIRLNNIVIGTFNVYAVETHFFDEDEIKLLEEAALDISFALEIFRDEDKRKQMEQALRESEEKFRTLTASSPVGMFLNDAHGNATYINEKCAELIGMPAEEALNLGWMSAIHPDDKEQVTTKWIKAVKSGEEFHMEYRWVHADGEVVWTLGDIVPVRGSDGEVTVNIGTLTDITDRKQAVKELLERRDENTKLAVIAKERAELQDWINTFDTFVAKLDPNGVGLIFNKAPIIAGGVAIDDVVGEYFPDTKWWLHSETERARVIECLEQAKAGLSSRIETNFRSAEGTPVPIIFNCTPVMDDDGKVRYITAEGKTIIEEVQLRTELQEAKVALETRVRKRTSELDEANIIINRSPAVAFRWKNEEGWPVDFVSENVEKLFGYSAQEFMKRKIYYSEIIHSNDLERVAEEVASYGEKKGVQTLTHKPYRIVTKNGNIKWIDDITYIQRDSGGIITHYEGIVFDITERKQVEEELEKHRGHLEELVKERTIELEKKNTELKRYNKLFVGREFRIKKLRDRVKKLEKIS